MSYRNERFNRRMMSLEVIVAGFADASKAKIFSDSGAGARAIREGGGERWRWRAEEKTREEKLFEAEMRLADAEKSHLIPVLLLIVENGNNRQESIRQMMIRGESEKSARKRYERHRKTLLTFFDVA